MKIGVIGTGISSLVASYCLCNDHELSIFDSGNYIGGHTNTIDVQYEGESHQVDSGFIVFNEPNYPHFCNLMKRLGVAWQPTEMSFSVRCDLSNLEYNGTGINRLFAQRRNILKPRFLKMISDILRFGKQASTILATASDQLTVQEYVDREKYSESFTNHYLIPLGASLWSCPAESFRKFPIRFVVEFLDNHCMLQIGGRPIWRVIQGGSKQYIPAITKQFKERIRLNARVKSVKRFPDHVELILHDGRRESFDQVIIGCHADTALAMLSDPTPTERELLSAFPYQFNQAILHADTSVLPKRKLAWASWNYRLNKNSGHQATVTYNMNRLQSLKSNHTFCVTLNDDTGIDPTKIIRRIDYHHPIYTANRSTAQKRHPEVIMQNRTSFCGAYWGYGFHEDGVKSGLAVANAFGGGLTGHPAARPS